MTTRSGRPLVAVDTMALVWGVRKEGAPEDQERAEWLFEELDEQEAQVLIASVVLTEYITPVSPDNHQDVIAALNQRFIIAPFDVRCASLAASLFSQGKKSRMMSVKHARSTLRSDCLIIATAHAHGARIFYSDDAKCRKLAARAPGMTVRQLPSIPPNLFLYKPDKSRSKRS